MTFSIDARLENGRPHLTVTDVESGQLRVDWTCQHLADAGSGTGPLLQEVQQLFKQLILLASVSEVTAQAPQHSNNISTRPKACHD